MVAVVGWMTDFLRGMLALGVLVLGCMVDEWGWVGWGGVSDWCRI